MIRLSIIFFLLFPLLAILPARTFMNQKGQKIEGELLKLDGQTAHIRMNSNNKSYEVPLKTLSQDDQDFITEWYRNQGSSSKKEANDTVSTATEDGYKPSFRDSAQKLKDAYQLKDNFDAPWPDRVAIDLDIEIKVVEESKAERKFIYHSPNYEFVCDVGLSKNVIKKFAVLFEATRQFCKELPISTVKSRVPDGAFRYRILLFEEQQNYINAGGPPNSAGVFRTSTQEIMVPLKSLGVKKVGSSYMYDYKGQNKTLPHEIVHQLTDNEYYASGSVGWFTEGIAEYVAVTDYRSGKFMVKSNRKEIMEYVTAYGEDGTGGRALGENIHVGDLKSYMMQPYKKFVAHSNTNYGVGLLLTYYFFHMDGDGDRQAITGFLKALKEGKKGEAALEALLNGRSFEELEKDIAKAWKSKGIELRF